MSESLSFQEKECDELSFAFKERERSEGVELLVHNETLCPAF